MPGEYYSGPGLYSFLISKNRQESSTSLETTLIPRIQRVSSWNFFGSWSKCEPVFANNVAVPRLFKINFTYQSGF